MTKQIETYIEENLSGESKRTALELVEFLRDNELTFYKDTCDCWKDKIYYWVKLGDECVCFIAIKDPDEPDNLWTIWSDDSFAYEDASISGEIKNVGWQYVDHCGNCGSCGGGKEKIIFGKSFPRVCGCRINRDEYNTVSWIVGATHFAVIVNNELRYCGTNFPYMSLDLNSTDTKPIIIGGDGQGKKYIRKIKVSQLKFVPKSKLKKEELAMYIKQSNNMIPIIHRLITSEHGENYWFNGCAAYVMESLGETEYDYSFFAGLTGDCFVQHYKFGFFGDGIDSYYQFNGDGKFFEDIFDNCGYSATFVFSRDLCKNKEMYLHTLIGYIDKGVPVITLGIDGPPFGVFVGYEENGKTLLFISGDNDEPQRISYDKAMEDNNSNVGGWIFVGEKREDIPLAKIYKDAILALPGLLTTNNEQFCFGAAAFRKWADDIDGGIFDNMKPEEFEGWSMYQNFVCVLATNGSCCHIFLERVQKLNPEMNFLDKVDALYSKIKDMWGELEALGGGFNITLEALQDPEKRTRITAKIREFATVTDEIASVLTNSISERIKENE